ncbi:MAG TPA: hypothetical protein VGD73_11945 [Pseudonocardia sp.]|uniref:hypothetical protein n=1 Tax=Pseudonocardia sp. TaxID=60912 RepID=UPI002ED8F217
MSYTGPRRQTPHPPLPRPAQPSNEVPRRFPAPQRFAAPHGFPSQQPFPAQHQFPSQPRVQAQQRCHPPQRVQAQPRVPVQRRFIPAPPPLETPAQPQPPDSPVTPRSGFGVIALVFAVIGLVFGLVPLTWFVAVLCGTAGVGCGVLGIAQRGKGVAVTRAMSIAGALLSTAALVLGIWGVSFQLAAKPSAVGSTSQPVSLASLRPGQLPGDGTYRVGREIQPGSYRTQGPADAASPNCYWSRNSDASGEVRAIIANSKAPIPATVTVKPGDATFHTTGCQPWTKVN